LKSVSLVAAARGVPRAQVALAWLLAKPGITAPIVGATNCTISTMLSHP
jgi:aryl-alcohol dehydrogenase-like predicted oxidoreductase